MAEKSKARLWMENFWYHNKWKTIFVLFVVMVVIICVMQMESQTDYDAQVLYVGPHFWEAEEKAEVESAFAQILSGDVNGDGKKNALLADLTILTSQQMTQVLSANDDPTALAKYGPYSEDSRKQSFAQEMAVGENLICLLDPYWYEQITDKSGIASLSSVLGYQPQNAIDEYGVYLKDTEFGQYYQAFDVLPDDTILCFRILSASMLAGGSDRAQKHYERQKEIFRSVMDFRFPQGYEAETKPKESGV